MVSQNTHAILRAKLTCLAIGALGGGLFYALHLPLPFMLGSMCLTTAAAMMGLPVLMMPRVRVFFISIIGIMLGSAFTPDILAHALEWDKSLLWLALYIVVSTFMVRWFYRRAGYDPVTAYFSAAPGGLTEMILSGIQYGGDERRISLSHGARIFIAVFILSFGYRWANGSNLTLLGKTTIASQFHMNEWILLSIAGALGFWLAKKIRLPAYVLIGPMLASAILHGADITQAKVPFWLMAIAQIVIGSAVGSRFNGIRPREVFSAIFLAGIATVILLVLAIIFSWLVEQSIGIPLPAALLAFAPGGLTEMSLIAFSLGIDAAYVSTHHIARIFIIILAAPFLFRILNRYQ